MSFLLSPAKLVDHATAATTFAMIVTRAGDAENTLFISSSSPKTGNPSAATRKLRVNYRGRRFRYSGSRFPDDHDLAVPDAPRGSVEPGAPGHTVR